MKPNDPTRRALMIARQRAAPGARSRFNPLGPICHEGEDEKGVLRFASGDPLANIGRPFITARSRIAKDALSRALEKGVRQIVILGAGLDTLALRNPHGALEICKLAGFGISK